MWIKETHISVYRDAIYLMKFRGFFIININSLKDDYSSKVEAIMQLISIISFILWFVFIFWPLQNIINYMKTKENVLDTWK